MRQWLRPRRVAPGRPARDADPHDSLSFAAAITGRPGGPAGHRGAGGVQRAARGRGPAGAAGVLLVAALGRRRGGRPAVPVRRGAAAVLRRRGGRSRQEQAGVAGAETATLHALAAGNEAYQRRFGHVYLVCATGRTAAELLALLRARLGNEPGAE